jgi:hypothetical protein
MEGFRAARHILQGEWKRRGSISQAIYVGIIIHLDTLNHAYLTL